MTDLNVIIGGVLTGAGVLAFLVACAIATRQYVFDITRRLQSGIAPVEDLAKVFLELLREMLKAPPALAFLVASLLLFSGGAAVLHYKPF